MGDTLIGGGQAVRQSDKRSHGAYAPGHYLKQFLPEYTGGEDAANAAAKAAGYDNWVALPALQEGLDAQPRAAGGRPVPHHPADQQPDLGDGAQPFYWAVDTPPTSFSTMRMTPSGGPSVAPARADWRRRPWRRRRR